MLIHTVFAFQLQVQNLYNLAFILIFFLYYPRGRGKLSTDTNYGQNKLVRPGANLNEKEDTASIRTPSTLAWTEQQSLLSLRKTLEKTNLKSTIESKLFGLD